MKKLLLVAAILGGAVTASHAGVNFHIGIGVPLPPPVIISRPAPVYCPPPVVYTPHCPPPVVYAPRHTWAPVVVDRHHHHRGPRHGYRYEERYRGYGYSERHVYRGHWNHH